MFDDDMMAKLKTVVGKFEDIRIIRSGQDAVVDELFQAIDEADTVILQYGKMFTDLMYPDMDKEKLAKVTKEFVLREGTSVSYRFTQQYLPLFSWYCAGYKSGLEYMKWYAIF